MNPNFQNVRAILFDLDDTLYDERDFFRSGFSAVASELNRRGIGRTADLLERLEHFHHNESRDGVLQKLRNHAPFPEAWVAELAEIFRTHEPLIAFARDTVQVLPRLRKQFKLGCVTDGYARVQTLKLKALGAPGWLDAVVLTDDVGRAFWKPHPLPFVKCCEQLGVAADRALFVGDSPERDVAGAANAGMRCVRIRRPGAYLERHEPAADCARPVCEVRSLFELEQLLAPTVASQGANEKNSPLPA